MMGVGKGHKGVRQAARSERVSDLRGGGGEGGGGGDPAPAVDVLRHRLRGGGALAPAGVGGQGAVKGEEMRTEMMLVGGVWLPVLSKPPSFRSLVPTRPVSPRLNAPHLG